jgi:hypothetical protein
MTPLFNKPNFKNHVDFFVKQTPALKRKEHLAVQNPSLWITE